MAHKICVLIVLLSAGLAASQEDLAVDDECSGTEGEVCAVSALQRRSSLVMKHGADVDLASEEPDFELRDDTEGLSDDELGAGEDLVEFDDTENSDGMPETSPATAEASDSKQQDLANAEDSDSMPSESAALVQSPFDTAPNGENCHKNNMTCPSGQKCVVKYDATYSQCMSCEASVYDKECQKLGDYMRYAAMHTCKRTCQDTKCYNKNWCMKPYRCVVDQAANWGQCVSCRSKKQWTASCHGWTKGFYKQAKKTCHKRCRYGKR